MMHDRNGVACRACSARKLGSGWLLGRPIAPHRLLGGRMWTENRANSKKQK